MTLKAHGDLGVAQVVLYTPALAADIYLAFKKHKEPRLVWRALGTFSSIRIASGILLILFESHKHSVGYISAVLALEGAGVIPAILSTLGMFLIIQSTDISTSRRLKHISIGVQVLLFTAIALVSAGGGLLGDYKNANSVSTGRAMTKAAYILLVVNVAILASVAAYFWSTRRNFALTSSSTILYGVTASLPLFVVRVVYSCLSTFGQGVLDPTWSPLYGKIAPLVIMSFLMEYLAVVIYLSVGFAIPPVRKTKRASPDEEVSRV